MSNADAALRAGTAATATVDVERPRPRLVVPESALTVEGDSTVVFVVGKDSVAHRRPVVPGVRRGGRVTIEGNVAPGDRVVTQGALGLQDSTHVVPQAQSQATE
jgi:cobalt-zinc-cadmium efflux system membrane fusion protein